MVSSLVGTVALLLDVNILAYVSGAVGLLETIRKVVIEEESDKLFWMSIITVVVLAIKPNFTWWQALLIVFLVKTLICEINIIAYTGGSLVILNIIFQASEGNINSLSVLRISIIIGISGVLCADTSWISITLISTCAIRTVMFIGRYLEYMLFTRNSLRES